MGRIFTVTVITDVDLVSDTPGIAENVLKHLTGVVGGAAGQLSLRSVNSVRVLYCGGGVVDSEKQTHG